VDGYLTDLITDRSVDFIAKSASPFFLEVCYNAPHWPFQKPGDAARSKATYGPETGTRTDYVKMVERLDDGVGQIVKALNERKLDENTLVIFVSDNGGERLSDNGALFHGKYTLWEGGIRVPCILKWPGKLVAGKTRTQPTITMDLTATILAAAGMPAKLDGIDLLAESKEERTFCWRLPRPSAQFGQKAVRRGDWKYIADRDSELLFDLAKDIGERTNLAYKYPEIVKDLKSRLADWEAILP
jgi:arylsulfatase A-like enzyme